MLELAAHRGPRRLGHGLVGGQARHALDGEGGLVERPAGQRALDQLVEPREDGRRLVVRVAAQELEERLGELPAHRVLRERRHSLPERLERAEHDGRPRRPGEHGPREERQVVLRVVPVDVLVAEQREELPAEDLEIPGRRRLVLVRARCAWRRGAPPGAGRGARAARPRRPAGASRGARGAALMEEVKAWSASSPSGSAATTRSAARMRLSRRGSGSRMISCAVWRAASARPAPDIPWKCAVVVSVSRTRSWAGVTPGGASLPSTALSSVGAPDPAPSPAPSDQAAPARSLAAEPRLRRRRRVDGVSGALASRALSTGSGALGRTADPRRRHRSRAPMRRDRVPSAESVAAPRPAGPGRPVAPRRGPEPLPVPPAPSPAPPAPAAAAAGCRGVSAPVRRSPRSRAAWAFRKFRSQPTIASSAGTTAPGRGLIAAPVRRRRPRPTRGAR